MVEYKQVYTRLECFGLIGSELYGVVADNRSFMLSLEVLIGLGRIENCLAEAQNSIDRLRELYGVKYSSVAALILYRIPLQHHVTVETVEFLLLNSMLKKEAEIASRFDAKEVELMHSKDKMVFPIKDMPEALIKSNVWFSDVLADVKEYKPDVYDYFVGNCGFLRGAYNDHVSALLAWISVVWAKSSILSRWVMNYHESQDMLKGLSNILKSWGVLADKRLACFVETVMLTGRGANRMNAREDAKARLDEGVFVDDKWCHIDGDALRAAIIKIRDVELRGRKVAWPTKEEHWSKRWLWCKSGSHGKAIERHMFGEVVDKARATRRMFIEECEVNLIGFGDTKTFVGQSEKMELDKGRALYNCDTRNYCTFDYLISPVEKQWRGVNVDLDPGAKHDCERYNSLGAAVRNWCLMMDYEDFNSQHSLSAQKLVIEVLCDGADTEVLRWALESFDNMWLKVQSSGDDERERVIGTLMSGHRATSFINSVLNRAYMLVVLGDELMINIDSKHVGDDIIMMMDASTDVDEVLRLVGESKLRMKKIKQGLGRRSGEFLRVAFDGKSAIGYLPRAIGAFVCGNWTSEKVLSGDELLMMYPQTAWAVRNRAMDREACMWMVSSLVRRSKKVISRDVAVSIVRGDCSINTGPVYRAEGWTTLRLLVGSDKVEGEMECKRYGKNRGLATKEYLQKYVNDGVLDELKLTKKDLFRPMLMSSYGVEIVGKILYKVELVRGEFTADYFNDCTTKLEKRESVLARYFTLNYVKALLKTDTLMQFCARHNIPFVLGAFTGSYGRYRVMIGSIDYMSYSDICQYGYIMSNPTIIGNAYQVAK